ncbi:hypothetical protein JG688_00004667 [Phytophthora aleatoria]|uniref:Uncharacterized protein n=1 Tax=Phytophthora aleatoria TaxID=2496075 RepID=A0A8J5J0J4_9STRA|nr:hypothetical protein JG688_00004667 [Phytophthora aleatoria]
MATRTGRLIVDPRSGKMVEEYKEDLMAVALFDPNITKPEDYKFRFVPRSEFTVPNINLLFECNAALLKDPFSNVIWPKDWMTQVLPPNGADRWYYIIHERVEPIPQDDLQDPLYTGGALLVLAFVPAQCEPIDIRTWLLFGITQEFQPLLRLKPLVATSRQKLKVLKEKINALPALDLAGTQQQQTDTRKNLADAMNVQVKELTDEIAELERRRKRMTKLIMTEPITLTEIPRDAELPSTSIKDEVETKTWAATFTSPRGRDLASLALGKNDWNYLCLVQTRPQPRAFFEDDQLSNQTIDPDDLLKEINMRTFFTVLPASELFQMGRSLKDHLSKASRMDVAGSSNVMVTNMKVSLMAALDTDVVRLDLKAGDLSMWGFGTKMPWMAEEIFTTVFMTTLLTTNGLAILESQRELENLTMYYTLLDDFYEQWTKRKREEHEDNLLDDDELSRVQEEREALRAFDEQRARFRKEKYDLSSRKKSLANFEGYLERVTLTENVKLERAADWIDTSSTETK